ncbi:MAG: two-component regulator propeller domain-containing protein [Chitinophagaceae bacterium]
MKAVLLRGLFFLHLLISLHQPAFAQGDNLRFEHIGFEEGLSNENVTAILQDSKGYIWFGTANGLNKYDGYTFTKYKFDPFDSNSVSQNLIYTIFEDKFGCIWVSTFEGLCKFDRATEKFTRYKPSPKTRFADPNIGVINEDSDGMIWVGSYSGGLCRFDRLTGKFLPEYFDLGYSKMPGDQAAGLKDAIFCIYKDKTGTLWVGNTTGLHKINLTAAKAGQASEVSFTHYQYDSTNPNSISSNFVTSVFEDKAGIIWVMTNNGLNRLDKNKGSFKHYQHDPKNIHTISSNYSSSWGGNGIKEDQQGNLWISTSKGLNKLNKDRALFTAYFHNPDDPYSISTDNIQNLEIDRAGILFAGSWSGKLNKVNLNDKGFGLRRNDPDNINSLSNNEVTSIVEDSAGIIWIGTYNGGLNRWDRKTNQFIHFRHDPTNPKTLRHDAIHAILDDRHGHLWVCNGDILSLFNKQTGEFTHYNSNEANYKEQDEFSIYSITEDRQGLIWLGTGNGIKNFDEKTGKFRHYYHSKTDFTGISDYTAIAIFADSRENIWVGYGSIATDRLNKRTGRIDHFKHDVQDSASISSNIVSSFHEDSKGNLWLGTWAGGLCYFNYQKEKFTTLTEKHGLPDNTVFSILEDSKNHLWLGTQSGLSRFDPVAKTFINYDYRDGLQSNIFAAGNRSRGAHCKGRDGTLYFGGNNGFNFFDPFTLKTSSTISPVVITQFKLFDKLVKGANESKEIVLNYDENYFSFEFSSLSYNNPNQNQYAYQLEGFDKDWVHSGSRRYAGYTNVDPGRYVFRAKGTNSDGVWNEKGTSIIIIIRPPWWRSWWAYTFYGAFFIAGIFFIDRYQRRRLINKERERTREKELEQAREIEKAYHELKNTQAQLIQSEKMASLGELTAGIAHEIQNPLNFVNNFSEVNTELIEEMQQELRAGKIDDAMVISNAIKENEEKINHHGKRADTIVKGMLQHSRSSNGVKEPTDINKLADEYLRLAYHGLRAKDKSFNVTMKTDYDENIRNINIIPQDIGRVFLNLYNNAFYAAPLPPPKESGVLRTEGGFKDPINKHEPTVWVSTKKVGDQVLISVRDNGPGIPQKVIDKIFQPFFTTKPTGEGTGLGLSLSYDIVKAHGGELNVETSESEGSIFKVLLPILSL